MLKNRVINRNMSLAGLYRHSINMLVIMLTAMLAVLSGCASRPAIPEEAKGKVIVVATIFPLADWAKAIGGDRVYVETLLPAGASPHTFDPGPRDMRMISHSKVFLKAGLSMDDWGASLIKSAGKDAPLVVNVGNQLQDDARLPDVEHMDGDVENIGHAALEDEHEHQHHDHGSINPHFWLDPQIAMYSVEIIKNALVEVDPDGKAAYEANAAQYLEKLKELDGELMDKFQGAGGKGFVSFHNAWPYLAHRYNLKIAAVIEEYPGKTPSEKYLRTVTDRLKELGITTVFSEPQLNPHVARLIAEEIGGQVGILDPYGTEGTADRGDYLKMMRYNASELAEAIGKSAQPEN